MVVTSKVESKKEAGDKNVDEQTSASQQPTTLSGLLRQTGPTIAKNDKEQSASVGWLPGGQKCGLCDKGVVKNGGVFCGRRRPDGTLVGCFLGVCWKCMNKAPCATFGNIRTTKAEFTSLGDDAWWMHEACMTASDLKDYNGVEEDESQREPIPSKSKESSRKNTKDKQTKTFAWE